jgi:type III secretion protein S
MPQATIASMLYKILWDCAILVGPPLLVSTVVAFLIGVFQAVTQTQEQTLPQTVKMVLIAGMLLSFGSVLAAPFFATSVEIFTTFHLYQR